MSATVWRTVSRSEVATLVAAYEWRLVATSFETADGHACTTYALPLVEAPFEVVVYKVESIGGDVFEYFVNALLFPLEGSDV